MTGFPPFPSDPADLPAWVAGLTAEQQQALIQEVAGGGLLAGLSARSGVAGAGGPFADFDRPNPEIELPPPPATPSTYVLRVDIADAKPPIWRRLAVRSDLTLDAVHVVLQAAFGWFDYHLHRFSLGAPYVSPFFVTPQDLEEGEEGTREEEARLDQVLTEPGARISYEYDFGDSWTHRILLESAEPWPEEETRSAWCLTGRRAGPLEDSGGIGSYVELAAWVRSGYADQHAPGNAEDLVDWIPDGFHPDHFSAEEVDAAIEAALLGDAGVIARSLGARAGLVQLAASLAGDASATVARWLLAAHLDETGGAASVDAETAEAATRAWRVLLRHVGDGVTLTQAGYLPPAIVRAVYDELGLDRTWIGKGNREDQTLPVLLLREQAQALGLLRKAKGRLAPTASGRRLVDDPAGLLAHVADRLPAGRREEEQGAGWLLLLGTAAGEAGSGLYRDIAAILTDLGWRTSNPAGLDERVAAHAARPTEDVLDCAAGTGMFGRSAAPRPYAALLARLALVGR